ncbi:hypothetical protein G6011_07521 [Alternaria panax]|uniref:Uncharacterized protein n=1 Tax=Alternaria panax TaxID=48097 RepID=A0AAD4I937_9PLEO|nr:hypothetical protein G6011_07521 [Alternaria panax]
MSDQPKKPVETGYSTANGQLVDQTHHKDEQISVARFTEIEGGMQTNLTRNPIPSTAAQPARTYSGQVAQVQKPQLTSTSSFASRNQDNRGAPQFAALGDPSNAQPPGSYPAEQQYSAPLHDKSNGGKSGNSKKWWGRGEPSYGQRYEDDISQKDNHSRKDYHFRKDDHSRRDVFMSKEQRYKAERNEAKQAQKEHAEVTHKKILELERALQAEQDTVRTIKLSAHELQKTKDTKELVFGVQETDDIIRSKFESLLVDIRTWASDFACTMGQELHLEDPMLSEYQQVAPSCATQEQLHAIVKSEKAKQDKKQKRHFIRGWTSCVMINSFFRTLDDQGTIGEDVWLSEDDWTAFKRLENILWHAADNIVSPRSFNDWRALTIHLLSDATEHASRKERLKARSELAAHKVMSLVHVWADAKKVPDLKASLVDIFQDALLFSQFLRQQRALWTPRLPTMLSHVGPLMFDAGCMKDDNLSDDEDDDGAGGAQYRQKYVLLVISPALYKRGNMDGAKFDSERAVVPARVTVATT